MSSDKNLNQKKKTFLRAIKSVRCIKANELQKLWHVNLTTVVGLEQTWPWPWPARIKLGLPQSRMPYFSSCFFRHMSEVKEKLSLTVIFEYNGRQNNNKEYRLLRNSLWTAVKSSMGGGSFWLQTSARYYARKAQVQLLRLKLSRLTKGSSIWKLTKSSTIWR